MSPSVPFVSISAARAAFARIARIDDGQRDTRALGLVFQERAKLAKAPVGQAMATGASGRDLGSDVPKFFDCDSSSSALRVGHDSLRDAMVGMGLESPLLSGELPQAPLCRFGSDALEAGPALGMSDAHLFDVCPV